MIRVGCPVVVEGRYDRIRLSSVIEGAVIETGGFRIRRDRALLEALRALAHTTGLIILTDSDAAGFRIRNFLKGALGPDAKLTHVYIPAIAGKERRKAAPSAEGLLGVEGMDEATLREAFARAGLACETALPDAGLRRADLYDAGLIGAPDSAARRRRLCEALRLPPRLSTATLLTLLNTLLTREQFEAQVQKLRTGAFPEAEEVNAR